MSQRALTARLNARMLLNDNVYWPHPDLVALRHGLDWELAQGRTGALANKFIDVSQLWFMHLFLSSPFVFSDNKPFSDHPVAAAIVSTVSHGRGGYSPPGLPGEWSPQPA